LTRIIYSAESDEKWGENEIDYILFLRSNITLDPNWNEVKSLKYISRNELDLFVEKAKEDGSGVTPWFNLIAGSLLPKWWDKLDSLDEFKNHTEIIRFL
jgi:isopentenyl-diphosphate delta-isomerase